MNFDWLFELFKKNRIEFFVKADTLNIEKLLIEKFTKEKRKGVIDLRKPVNIYNLDPEMILCTKKDMETYLKSDFLSFRTYKKDRNDCDDFAIHLWSRIKKDYPLLAFGFVLSAKHAFNIFMDNNLNVWIVEPQNDKLMTLEEAQKKDLYKNITLVIM